MGETAHLLKCNFHAFMILESFHVFTGTIVVFYGHFHSCNPIMNNSYLGKINLSKDSSKLHHPVLVILTTTKTQTCIREVRIDYRKKHFCIRVQV